MILSQEQLFSDGQAVTASAPSENYIDLGATGTPKAGDKPLVRDIGKGTKIPLSVIVTEDFATLTSLTVEVQVDSNSDFSTAETVQRTIAIPASELVAGKRIPIDDFHAGVDKRYLRLNYAVAGTNATAGKLTAGVSMGNQTNVPS